MVDYVLNYSHLFQHEQLLLKRIVFVPSQNSQNKTVFMKDNAKSGVNYSTGNKLSKGKAYKIIVIAWSKDEKGKAYSYELGSKSFLKLLAKF